MCCKTQTRHGATISITTVLYVIARAFPSRIKSLCKHNQIVFWPWLTTACFKSLFIQCKNSQTFKMHLIWTTAYRTPQWSDFNRKTRCSWKFRTCYRNNPCLSCFSCSLLPIVPLFSKWCRVTDEGNLNDSFIRSFFKTFMPRNSFTQVYTENWSYTKDGLKRSKAPKGTRSSQQDDPKWWLQVINHIKKRHC